MKRLPRSYLYVPGVDTKRMAKALTVGTDAMILDLEDAVPTDQKLSARDTVVEWVTTHREASPEVWVRVNAGEPGLEDIGALLDCPGLAGLVLAKADLPQVRAAAKLVSAFGLSLSPLLETAAAVLDARQIAELGVELLQIGEYDLCADVGIIPGEREHETSWARSMVVFASSAAGTAPPVAPVSIEIRDTDRFAESTLLAARQGFVGRACIHPRQVEVVNEVFTPSAKALESARETVEHFEALDGGAVMVDEAGRLVDEATVRAARRTLALADTTASSGATTRERTISRDGSPR